MVGLIKKMAGRDACPTKGNMSELKIYHRRLPHWRMEGMTYFLTWRLDLLQAVLSEDERTLVQSAILFFNKQRYDIHAYVVMDDHITSYLLLCRNGS